MRRGIINGVLLTPYTVVCNDGAIYLQKSECNLCDKGIWVYFKSESTAWAKDRRRNLSITSIRAQPPGTSYSFQGDSICVGCSEFLYNCLKAKNKFNLLK